ncbi:MAG: DUF2461 domain-containing protein [Oscillospiraceae bacterium]|nr:DUF2461 domain-containing protein [Oscillospiraceae bacterium]
MVSDFDRILQYSADLAANNNRTWFHEHHDAYDAARADFAELLETLRFSVCRGAPSLEADIMYTRVKDWTYRIPRDARMHRDLPPYNPSFWAYISADRRSWLPIGYFLHIAHDACFFGTGVWCESTAKTNQVRDYITNHAGELEELLRQAEVDLQGDSLKTMPRGYAADCPGAKWIKLKNWMFFENLPKKAFKSFSACGKVIEERTARYEPLRQFLFRAATEENSYGEQLKAFYSVREPDMW